tara:strand:- start:23111 stop:23290 length:180 start_codon:yes stop_codon:yes gene_type:complete
MSDEVKRALDYLRGSKEEMTSDKKHYTEVLIKEVKRLRERVATLESLMEYMADEEKVIE